jgi:hypothetical protein
VIELLLNAAWLVLVTGAVTAFLRTHARADLRAFLLGLGALVCSVSLLLPSISITDDLHFDAFVVEDSSGTKRMASTGPHAAPVAPVVWLAVALSGILLASPPQLRRRILLANVRSYVSSWFLQPLAGRAPPRFVAA